MRLTLLLVFILTLATCAVSPAAEAVWVSGQWVWTQNQYTWVPGYYSQPPAQVVYVSPPVQYQPTVVYVQQPPRVVYVQQPQSTFLMGGYYGSSFYGHNCYSGYNRGVTFSGHFTFRK